MLCEVGDGGAIGRVWPFEVADRAGPDWSATTVARTPTQTKQISFCINVTEFYFNRADLLRAVGRDRDVTFGSFRSRATPSCSGVRLATYDRNI